MVFKPKSKPKSVVHGANGGYVSEDGHQFSCTDPITLEQAFHVYEFYFCSFPFTIDDAHFRIFVIDRY